MIVDNKPYRRSIRLKTWDYSTPWYYFVTICTHEKHNLFGQIQKRQMVLNAWGKTIETIWWSLPKHHHVELDQFVIMPNHVHGILILSVCRGIACNARDDKQNNIQTGFARKTLTRENRFAQVIAGTLSCVIRSFKSESTKQIRKQTENDYPVWQRNYYEHIIRNEKELEQTQKYIHDNPQNWEEDEEFRD
ncbi:MAG: transposase [Candidatus Shapirobacteria bacterium]